MFEPALPGLSRKIGKFFMFNSPLWYWFLEKIAVQNTQKQIPLAFANFNEFMLYCSSFYDPLLPTFQERFEQLCKSNIPLSVVYGEREKLIPKHAVDKVNQIMGFSPEDIVKLDPKNQDEDVPLTGKLHNSYAIGGSGHFAHINHPRFSNKIVDNLLKQISN